MSRGFFITGTDTGIGKTVVTAGILRWLRGQGVDAVPMKPVQTGAIKKGDRLVSPDIEFCLAASGWKPNEEEAQLIAPYLYEPACSPHLAGRMAVKYPEISEIKRCAETLLQKHQALLVEGAGGRVGSALEELSDSRQESIRPGCAAVGRSGEPDIGGTAILDASGLKCGHDGGPKRKCVRLDLGHVLAGLIGKGVSAELNQSHAQGEHREQNRGDAENTGHGIFSLYAE